MRGKKQLFLKLEEGQSNELIFYAKNLGKISPNTTAITLIDKNEKKEFEINSNLDANGKITLINTRKIQEDLFRDPNYWLYTFTLLNTIFFNITESTPPNSFSLYTVP